MDPVILMKSSSEFADFGLERPTVEHRQVQNPTKINGADMVPDRTPEMVPATPVSDEFVRIAIPHSKSSFV